MFPGRPRRSKHAIVSKTMPVVHIEAHIATAPCYAEPTIRIKRIESKLLRDDDDDHRGLVMTRWAWPIPFAGRGIHTSTKTKISKMKKKKEQKKNNNKFIHRMVRALCTNSNLGSMRPMQKMHTLQRNIERTNETQRTRRQNEKKNTQLPLARCRTMIDL